MKVEIKAPNAYSTKRQLEAPIPFERKSPKKLDKRDLVRFKLHSTPADDDSPLYEVSIGMFESGTPEELLIFLTKTNEILVGQNATTGPPKYVLMRRLLHGDALAAFKAGAAAAGAKTNAHFTQTVNLLIEHVFPSCVLVIQKRCHAT